MENSIFVDFQTFQFKTRKDRSLFIVWISMLGISYLLFGIVTNSVGLRMGAITISGLALVQIVEFYRSNRILTHFLGKSYFQINAESITYKPGVLRKAIHIPRNEIESIEVRLYHAVVKTRHRDIKLDFTTIRDEDLKSIKATLKQL